MSRLEETMAKIGPLDQRAMALAQARQDTLTKPRRSLGRLEALSVQVAGISGRSMPQLRRKVVITMAGDHGVAVEGVSAYPQEVTAQMVSNFLAGGAAINVLSRYVGARVVVVDLGVAQELPSHPLLVHKKIAYGTGNLCREPAMTPEQALRSLEAGIEVVEQETAKGMDVVATGDMGIGNTTPASAMVAAFTGEPVEAVTGRGTGITEEQRAHKVQIIQQGLELHRPDPRDPLDVLAKVGGLEIGGLAGVMLGAASYRIPVVIDGFVSGAAALLASALCPAVNDYLIAAHQSVEVGHRAALHHLGLSPLLDLGLRLGEGTGAALGIMLVEAAVKVLAEMATFEEAQVSRALEVRISLPS